MPRAAAATGPGDAFHVAVANFVIHLWPDGGSSYDGISGNSPFLRTDSSGAVWDFSNSADTADYRLGVGRFANGAYESTIDAGITLVRTSGWDFDSAGHPWGAMYRAAQVAGQPVPLGVFVVRLD